MDRQARRAVVNKLGSPEATATARAWRIALAALLVVAATTGQAATNQPRESPQERAAPATPVDEPLRGAAALEALKNLARAAPFAQGSALGVTSAGPNLPGAFRIRMAIPGGVGPEVKLDVVSLGPQGGPIDPPGDPALLPGLPRTALMGENGLVLRRMSDQPWQEGYLLYQSEPVVVLSDLRASRAYARTSAEEALCPRCDPAEEGVSPDARELLSGYSIAVRFPPALRERLLRIYPDTFLKQAETSIESVPWDVSPSVGQEPRLNPSTGSGEVAPGTLLHSGEYTHSVTDLYVRGRGIDVAFTRTYRSGTVGSGPLGPGWELGYRVRLRELPDGSVWFYDGRGRRELFVKDGDRYQPPPGFFADLSRNSSGWLFIDAEFNRHRFDRWGQRVSFADAAKDSVDTGNELRFGYTLSGRLLYVEDDLGRRYALSYDAAGRITSIRDFADRTVAYAYDAHGRLASVTSPAVTVGETTFPSGLTTTYTYETPPSGSLAAALNTRDNLTSITDARGETWLELSYTDADGDGRAEEVMGETWGGSPLSIAYDFTGRMTTVTDRRGHPWVYEHDADGHPTEFTDPAGAIRQAAYDADGLVTLETFPLGRTIAYAYNSSGDVRSRGNLLSVTVTPDGRGTNGSSSSLATTVAYHPRTNQPIRVTDPRGAVTSIERTSLGLPVRVTRALGTPEASVTAIEYNAFGQPTRVINPNGHPTEYRYHPSGPSKGYPESTVVDPGGLAITTRYETDQLGRVTAMIDPRGVRHETVYNELGWVVEETAATTPAQDGSATPALGYTTRYLHDESGNVIERRDPVGEGTSHAVTRFTYGVLGELLSSAHTVVPGGQIVENTQEYDAGFLLVRTTDPVGTVTELVRDGRGLPTSVTAGVGTSAAATETSSYNLEGQRVVRTDARGFAWTTEYDGYGRRAASVDPVGNRAETSYGDDGLPLEHRRLNPSGGLLSRSGATYDLLGREIEAKRFLWIGSNPSGAEELVASFGYDPVGNLLTASDPLSRVTSRVYDAAERLATVTDPAGNVTAFTYDTAGNITRLVETEQSVSGAASVSFDFGYDTLGRRLWSEDALGNREQTLWDAHSNPIVSIDAEGNITARTFDSLGLLLSETWPEGIAVSYSYDAARRLVSYTDALGQTTTYQYDSLGRLTSVTYPDSTLETYAYNPTGDLTQISQPTGSVVTFTHDALGRRVSRAVAPGAGVVGAVSEAYTLDGLGRLTQASSGSVAVTRSYDSLSRVASETAAGRTVAYTYDDANSLAALNYPSGRAITHGIDALGRPESISSGASPAAAYSFRGVSRVAGEDLGGGALTGTITFDPAGRILERAITDVGGLDVYGERISWSPRNLKTAQVRRDRNDRGFAFAHDAAGRLVLAADLSDPASAFPNNTAVEPAALAGVPDTFTFAYDTAENLLARGRAEEGLPETLALPLDSSGRNRPASVGGVPLAWDANGNLAEKGDLRFSYDERNRLTRVTDAVGAEIARYDYDAFNRRVRAVRPGSTEETVWAGWQPVEIYRDGVLRERRTWGLGLDEAVRLEADLDGVGTLETTHLPVYDSTGNLVALTDAQGKPVERYTYSPYGERAIWVDLTPPVVEQVRSAGGELLIEVSEEVSTSALGAAVAAGDFALVGTAGGAALPIEVMQPVASGRQARRRLIVTTTDPPAPATEVRLTIAPAALSDFFFNRLAEPFELAFPWPAADTILHDTTAPRLAQVLVRDGRLEIGLTEEPDLAAAAAVIAVDGAAVTWTLSADRYTLLADDELAPGNHQVTISTAPLDLAGLGLAEAFSTSVTLTSGTESRTVYVAPDPRRASASTVGNRLGFKGLAHDPETGLVYMRHRYFDPELGRFLSPDPMGYADSPSLYQYAGNNPVNFSDPMGLLIQTGDRELEVIKGIVTKLGQPQLAETLTLQGGYIHIPGAEMMAWARAAGRNPTLSMLFKAIIDTFLDVDLRFVEDASLQAESGAKTSAPRIEFDRLGKRYSFDIFLDPSVIEQTRFRLALGHWYSMPLDVALIHELGHAVGTKELGLLKTHRVKNMPARPTDQYAVDREDEYRAFLGLPLRREHEIPAVTCFGGEWDSEECQQRLYCKARDFLWETIGCEEAWQKRDQDWVRTQIVEP